jgi:hypothetical protein
MISVTELERFLSEPEPEPMKSLFVEQGFIPLDETPEQRRERRLLQWQAAERLRESLCSVPFYAKRAEAARLKGNEMAYWIDLQGSEATLKRPASSTLAAHQANVRAEILRKPIID